MAGESRRHPGAAGIRAGAAGSDDGAAKTEARRPRVPGKVAAREALGGAITSGKAVEVMAPGVALGAAPTRADQAVDPAVGTELAVPRGDPVERGAVLGWVYVRREEDAEAVFPIGERAEAVPALVMGRIG